MRRLSRWISKAPNARPFVGGGGLIRRNRPILEICIYHKASDIYEIPAIIVSLDEDYVFYLRHYPSGLTEEVVLYALPK